MTAAEATLAPVATRLVEDPQAVVDAARAGRRERYARGVTSHTVHVWWARRPHATMRALVYACLCRSREPRDAALLEELGARHEAAPALLAEARRRLREQYARKPRVLDVFGGGGTIPFEALALGADVSAMDANPLSVFIQRSLLAHAHSAGRADLPALVAASGARVLRALEHDTAPLFPLRASGGAAGPVAYLWTYARVCAVCGYRFVLGRRPFVSKRGGRRLALHPRRGEEGDRLVLADAAPGERPESRWQGRREGAACPVCGHAEAKPDALACEDLPAALVIAEPRRGKRFVADASDAVPMPETLAEDERRLLDSLDMALPDTELPAWSGVVNPPLYGIHRHSDVFNARQRLVALRLLGLLREEHRRLTAREGAASARFVTGMLSGLVDQLVDWNSRLSMWIAENEQTGRAFCGPGVAMLWDYVEVDPCRAGPANLRSKLARIVAGCRFAASLPGAARVELGAAQSLPFDDASFDAVITDPPYYDNIPYAALADCFYAWKRLVLAEVEPELFAAPSTVNPRELVASRRDAGATPHDDYCRELGLAVRETARVLAPDGILALVYSHASLAGWEALVRALRASPLAVSAVQPLSVERRERPRAMRARAVNASLVFVARKTPSQSSSAEGDLLGRFRREVTDGGAGRLLDAGWDEPDTALALFGRGAALLANAELRSGDGAVAEWLARIESIVRERFPDFHLTRRRMI